MKKTAVVLLLFLVGIGGAMLFRKPDSERVFAYHTRPLPPPTEQTVMSKNESSAEKKWHSPAQGVPALPPKPKPESPQSQPRRPAVLQPGARPPLPQLSQFADNSAAGERATSRRRINAGSSNPSPAASVRRGQVSESDPRVVRKKAKIQTHTIVNGDTLERIARRYLGDAAWANTIYQINQDQITDPNRLPLGKKILIPASEQLPTRISSPNPPVKDLVPLPQWTVNDND